MYGPVHLCAEEVVVDLCELKFCHNLPTSKPTPMESLLSCSGTFNGCKLEVHEALHMQTNFSFIYYNQLLLAMALSTATKAFQGVGLQI